MTNLQTLVSTPFPKQTGVCLSDTRRKKILMKKSISYEKIISIGLLPGISIHPKSESSLTKAPNIMWRQIELGRRPRPRLRYESLGSRSLAVSIIIV